MAYNYDSKKNFMQVLGVPNMSDFDQKIWEKGCSQAGLFILTSCFSLRQLDQKLSFKLFLSNQVNKWEAKKKKFKKDKVLHCNGLPSYPCQGEGVTISKHVVALCYDTSKNSE